MWWYPPDMSERWQSAGVPRHGSILVVTVADARVWAVRIAAAGFFVLACPPDLAGRAAATFKFDAIVAIDESSKKKA